MHIIVHQHLAYLLSLSFALLLLFNPISGYAEENKPSEPNPTESAEKNQADAPPLEDLEESLSTLELIHEKLEELDEELNTLKRNRKKSPVKTLQKIEDIIKLIEQSLASLTTKTENNKKKTNINRSTLKAIEETIKKIQATIEEAQANIQNNNKSANEIKEEVATNAKQIEANSAEVKEEFLSKEREIQTNVTSIGELKGLIEDNAVRMYETLTKIKSVSENVSQLSKDLERIGHVDYIEDMKNDIGTSVDKLWTLITILLVFFVPLAFSLCNPDNDHKPLDNDSQRDQIQFPNQTVLMVSLTVFLGFFALGFGLMYGTTTAGWIGTSTYLLEMSSDFSEFILYQTGFVVLAAMIVYMALGQQLPNKSHILLALFVSIILIPIFGHWSASSSFITHNPGWLELTGFIDQAGSVRINTIAAFFALIIVLKLGAPASPKDSEKFHRPAYSSSAVLLLWISWLSFTTGSLVVADGEVSNIMLNVSLAAAAGGLMAYLQNSFSKQKSIQAEGGLGGFVAGLVAIAACAQSVSFAEAAVIGGSAGILQNIGYKLLRKLLLKEAWHTRAAHIVSIHGIGGIWGGLSVAIFETHGNFQAPNIEQLFIQGQGIIIAIAYSVVLAYIMVLILKLHKQTATAPPESTASQIPSPTQPDQTR